MEVKIYREPENENLIINEDNLKEYNSLAQELGIKTVESKSAKVPNIYISLNDSMEKQLKALCPREIKAEKYTKSTIPLEVLKVFKFAKDNQMFDGFYIWYTDKDPDPMLIGWKWPNEEAKNKGYSWNQNNYLIARWGDCALELNDLLKRGYQSIKQSLVDSVGLAKEQINSMEKNPDVYVRKYLKGEAPNINIDMSGTPTTDLPF